MIDSFNYKNKHGHEYGRRQCLRIALGTLLLVLLLAGAGSAATVTNWSFDTNNQSWTSSSSDACLPVNICTITWNGTDGNPAGSLYASFTNNANLFTTAEITWQSPNFTWNNGSPTANISVDVKIGTYHINGVTNPNNYSVLLVKPDNTTSLINKTTFTGIFNWSRFNYTVGAGNFSQSGNYSLRLKANLSAEFLIIPFTDPGVVSIGWDNINTASGIESTPPSVISNTNNVYVANNTFVTLNATITDLDSGVKNATVNVSSVNSTFNEAILINQSGFWINNSIIADRGDTNGFVNLTITAYDNASNVNNSINMTVAIDATPPVVTNASASGGNSSVPATILNDNGRARAPGTNITTINVTVTDNIGVGSVTINLSPIGGSANAPMVNIPSTNNYTITTNATAGVNLTNNLTVNATDTAGNSNTSVNVSLTVLRRGDVVRNNAVTGADALFIEQYVVGLQPGATAQQLFVGDVVPANITNGLTGGDALYIEELQVGLQTQQP